MVHATSTASTPITLEFDPKQYTRLNSLATELGISPSDLIKHWTLEQLKAVERRSSTASNSQLNPTPIQTEGAGILRTLLARSEVIEKESIILGHQMRGMGADLVDLMFALNEKVETLKAGLFVYADHLLRQQAHLSSEPLFQDQDILELLQVLFPNQPLDKVSQSNEAEPPMATAQTPAQVS